MKRAGNCQFKQFNECIQISVGEWSTARQDYEDMRVFIMDEDMFCAIKEPTVFRAFEEFIAGESVSLGEKVKLLQRG